MVTRERPDILIALNGDYSHDAALDALAQSADLVIACDGGANWLRARGRQPDYLVGDLDSISDEALAALESSNCVIERHPSAKDETDGELGVLKAAALGASRITLIGALGGRIDHELANIMLLAMPEIAQVPTTINDGRSHLTLVADQTVIQGAPGDTVSLIPWGGDALGITTTDLQYPLLDEALLMGPARGVSNVMLADAATVSLRAGRLLVIHTPIAERHHHV